MTIDSKSTADNLEATIQGLDHPVNTFTSIAHNNIMRVCRKRGIEVVLNVQGSDEALAGYNLYVAGFHFVK
jgi:asparagine synthase (glutamine-hydrolysing)